MVQRWVEATRVGRADRGPARSNHHRAIVCGLHEACKAETGRSQEVRRLPRRLRHRAPGVRTSGLKPKNCRSVSESGTRPAMPRSESIPRINPPESSGNAMDRRPVAGA